MNEDLKIIKKKYGESMMHLCRMLFPTVLDMKPGLLSEILLEHFHSNKSLYDDIVNDNMEEDFKNFIYSFIDVENNYEENVTKTPKELLDEAGYILYECKSEEEIQFFKKFYVQGEELCTFRGGRLNRCHVFFAVKKNVGEIKREDFKTPKRQDEYGTSVISIQFTKNKFHTLSIKNRYNHTVNNPDATFSNNLDNIISGLTESFAKTYGMEQKNNSNDFELCDYVKANDGKYYKFNDEIDGIYYCEDNIIIDNFKPIMKYHYEKERYIVMDYFILDLKEKTINLYEEYMEDSFIASIGEIKGIKVSSNNDGKIITITPTNGENIIINLDRQNRIIKLENKNVQTIGDKFLNYNIDLTTLELPKVQTIGDQFLKYNRNLTTLELPKVQTIGSCFLCNNENLTRLKLPNVQTIGDDFLLLNEDITTLELPNVQTIGDAFLSSNKDLTSLELPNVQTIGNWFLRSNKDLTRLKLPNVQTIGDCFLYSNKDLTRLKLPNVQTIGDSFLYSNKDLTSLELPNVQTIGNWFLRSNKDLTRLKLPNVQTIGDSFLCSNKDLTSLELPNVQTIGDWFLKDNEKLTTLELPRLQKIGAGRLDRNLEMFNLVYDIVEKNNKDLDLSHKQK